MTIADRIVLGLMWVSWRWARMHWSGLSRLSQREDFHPRLRRRLAKLEFRAWRRSCTAAARLHREERRARI